MSDRQPSLFDLFGAHTRGPVGAPFTPGSDTSEEAAESISEVAGRLRRRVYAHIVECGDVGTIDDTAEVVLDMKHTTYTARRGELVKQGLVRDSGSTDKTRSGRNAVLWVMVPGDEIEAAKKAYRAQEHRRTLVRAAHAKIKEMADTELGDFIASDDSGGWGDIFGYYEE